MSKLNPLEVSSYAGGATAIGAGLTLNQIGVLVGIATAVLTLIVNIIYTVRKDRREQRESDAALAKREAEK